MAVVGAEISTPHNSFLYFALTSGMVPFFLWVGILVASRLEFYFCTDEGDEGVFQLPILLYILINSMLGDISSDPWVLLSLSVGAGSGAVYAKKLRLSVQTVVSTRPKSFVPKGQPARCHTHSLLDPKFNVNG